LFSGFFLAFAARGQSIGGADSTADQVWVAVRAADKGPGQVDSEYYGSVDRKAFAAMTNLSAPAGFLKVSHAAWLINGKLIPLSSASYNGVLYGYKDVVYLRMDTIFRIVELNEALAKTRFPAGR
jgi:hypothetical protein